MRTGLVGFGAVAALTAFLLPAPADAAEAVPAAGGSATVTLTAPITPTAAGVILEVPPLPEGVPNPVPTGKPLSLAGAIAIALTMQPQVALAQHAAEAAKGRVRQAESVYFPSASISGQHTRIGPSRAGTTAVGGTFTAGGYTANLSARELLYDFGKTPASVGQARRQYDSAISGLDQTRQDTINQVKQAYYALLQAQQLVGVQYSNVTDQQAHLDLARGRYEVGVAPRSDVVTAEAAVAAAVLNLTTAQNTAAVALVNLNLAMGVDVRTPTLVQETTEAMLQLPPPAELVEQAFQNRPAVRQARANVEASRDALRGARAANRPGFFLNGNYGLSGSSFPPNNESWAYGVSLSWPFFDVGLTRGGVEAAEASLLSAEVTRRQTEQTVSSQVVQAYLNVQTARQQVTTAQSEVASAEESLRLHTGRYQTGVAAYIEVTDAETAAVTARTNLVNARSALSTSLAALQSALGVVEGE